MPHLSSLRTNAAPRDAAPRDAAPAGAASGGATSEVTAPGSTASRSSRRRRPGSHRALRALAGLAASAVLVVSGAGAASAHDQVLSTSPAADAVVEQVPDEVSLQLSAPALAQGTVLAVQAADGTDLVDGPPVLVDDTVTQPLVADRPAGPYTVQWRITSADGHPVSGSWTFQATAATTAAPAPAEPSTGTSSGPGATGSSAPSSSAEASDGSGAESSSPAVAQEPSATADDAGEGSGDSSGTAWGLLGGVAAVAVLVAAGVALARRRNRD